MQRIPVAVMFSVILVLPSLAAARETEHLLPVKEAVESETGKEKLFSSPFYMSGQSHPEIVEELEVVIAKRSTRGAFRTDKKSCEIAFLSAIRALQQAAILNDADAIVDIVSITWGKKVDSPREYRCVSGTFVVHVGLRGKLVRFGQ